MANNLGLMNAFCACCHQIGIVHLRNPLVFFFFFFVASHKLPCASPDVFITHMASEREGYVCTAKETGLTANLANWLLLHYDPSGLPPVHQFFGRTIYSSRNSITFSLNVKFIRPTSIVTVHSLTDITTEI